MRSVSKVGWVSPSNLGLKPLEPGITSWFSEITASPAAKYMQSAEFGEVVAEGTMIEWLKTKPYDYMFTLTVDPSLSETSWSWTRPGLTFLDKKIGQFQRDLSFCQRWYLSPTFWVAERFKDLNSDNPPAEFHAHVLASVCGRCAATATASWAANVGFKAETPAWNTELLSQDGYKSAVEYLLKYQFKEQTQVEILSWFTTQEFPWIDDCRFHHHIKKNNVTHLPREHQGRMEARGSWKWDNYTEHGYGETYQTKKDIAKVAARILNCSVVRNRMFLDKELTQEDKDLYNFVRQNNKALMEYDVLGYLNHKRKLRNGNSLWGSDQTDVV